MAGQSADSIDALSLEISSSTKKAEDAIDRLVSKLNGLSSALSFGNVSGLGELANGVSRLTGAMTGFKNSGVGKSDFSNIARSLNQLGKADVNGVSNAAIAIHTLTSNLSSLGTLAVDTQGIQNIATSISLLGRKTVTQAAQNIPAVNAVLSQLVTTMNNLGAVTFDVSGLDSLTTSISRLGGKAATNAIPNIQNLTAGLVQMMNTLASAPQVSQNLIQMTQAMAQLASAGGRVSSAANAMQTSMSNYKKSAVSASKSSRSLVSQLGLMVAKFYAIVRVAKGMWSSAESAMDYLETLNYFTQAFNQVASKADLSLWEDYGYASAEAYADSFEKRAKELTKKLTGFEIGDNGNLERTAVSSLGLDPDKTTQYQATFAQMASSMGVTSENALKLSNALTMIGADLASVRNLEFTDVWDDLASGMVGMSRTVDKYGVSIREADLQTQLFNLGIEAKVSSLTQADKALLRTITILNSTQYAWADLSETINAPANQLRLLTSNFTALSRTIGSLFLPIITKVLPYINAVTIALQRMFSWIGNLAGIDLSGISSSVGGAAVSMGDFADSEDDATASAKKLKKALSVLSFDALNQLNGDKDESGSSGGGVDAGVLDGLDTALDDALSRYQEVWDAAFESMENRANEMAEKIYNALEPIRKIIEDFKVGDFFQAGEDVSNLVSGIMRFFAKAINDVDWSGIGKSIGEFIAGINWTDVLSSIGELVMSAINASIKTWGGLFDAAPIETSIITAIALLKWTGIGQAFADGIVTSLKAEGAVIANRIGLAIMEVLPGIVPFISLFFETLSPGMIGEIGMFIERHLQGTFLDTSTWKGLPKAINDFIWNITYIVGDTLEEIIVWIGEGFVTAIKTVFNWNLAKQLLDQCVNAFGSIDKNTSILDIGMNIVKGIGNGILAALAFLSEPIFNLFSATVGAIKDLFGIHSPSTVMEEIGGYIVEGLLLGLKNSIQSVLEWVGNIPSWFLEKLGNAKEWLVDKGKDAIEGLKNGWETVKNSSLVQNAKSLGSTIITNVGNAKDWLVQKGKDAVSGLQSGWENIKSSSLIKTVGNLGKELITGIGDLSIDTRPKGEQAVTGMSEGVTQKTSVLNESFSRMSQAAIKSLDGMEPKFREIGAKLVLSLNTGIASGAPNITKQVSAMVSTISNSFKLLNTQMNNLGKSFMASLSDGILSNKEAVQRQVTSLMEFITNTLKLMPERMRQYGMQMMTALGNGISSNAPFVRNQVNNLVNNYIVNLITPVTQRLNVIGSNAIQSMSQGMNSSRNYISNSMQTILNLVFSYKGSLQSNGNLIGQWVNYGIYEGISSSMGYITGALNNVVNTVNSYSGSMYSAGQNLSRALQNGINSIQISGPSVSSSGSSSSKKSTRSILSENPQPLVSISSVPEAISTLSGFGKIGISPELQKYASYELGAGIAAQPISARIESSPYMRAISGSPANNFKSSGIDQTVLRDAVAQGVALAMMNNSGNQQPISVHATITLPDGRVLTDVVLDEFDRMEDVRPGTIGRRLGLVN